MPLPAKLPSALPGILLSVMGPAVLIFGCLGPESQFPNGRWPVVLVGCLFSLAGLQVLRVTIFRRSADGLGSAITAAMAFLLFSILLFWAAFAPHDGQNQYGGLFHDLLLWFGRDPEPLDARAGHIVCFALGLATLAGGITFLYRAVLLRRK